MADPLEELLTENTDITAADYRSALNASRTNKISLLQAFENIGKIPEAELLKLMASYYKVSHLDLGDKELSLEIVHLIPKAVAQQHRVIPIEKAGNNLIVAIGNPRNLEALDTIRFKCGFLAKAVLASETRISEAIVKYYGKMDLSKLESSSEASALSKSQADTLLGRKTIGDASGKDEGPIVKLVNDVLIKCLNSGASDIHFEIYEEYMRIRLRIDGSLMEIAKPPIALKGPLISRIKIMADLNIAESRLPQDGAININIAGKDIDFRVNTLPTAYGEKIVMRILDKSNLQVDMTQLGFEQEQLKLFQEAVLAPHGMVLVTGPTGSGKTTTLYSALQELNREDTNVMTAEDPVEYNLAGINQVQMKAEIGLNFSAALRSFLRQDPDVIMVGEIRDLETAEIGIKAALTGHLVLSTLHTNSASDTISRLLNMGVAPFNLIASLNCITAQRLMKKICVDCRMVDPDLNEKSLARLGIPSSFVSKVKGYIGKGCASCNNTGTKGRVAIHEVLYMNEEIKSAVLEGVSPLEIKHTAMRSGMKSLRQSALAKMVKGIVSAKEVVKVTSSDSAE